jgi:hypothetical protein
MGEFTSWSSNLGRCLIHTKSFSRLSSLRTSLISFGGSCHTRSLWSRTGSSQRRPSGDQGLRSEIPIRAISFKLHHRSSIRRPTRRIMSLFKLYSCSSFLPAPFLVILLFSLVYKEFGSSLALQLVFLLGFIPSRRHYSWSGL